MDARERRNPVQEIEEVRAAPAEPASVSAIRAAVRPGALAAVGAAAFVALLVTVERGTGLASLDPQVTQRVVGVRTPMLNAIAQVVTFLGSELWLAAVTVTAAGVLFICAERFRAAVVIVSMATSAASTVVIKLVVNRPRPGALEELGAPEASFSFPSGHTLNSTVCYGIIALMALPLSTSRTARVAIGSMVGALIIAVGSSRLYLGYHWVTDVLAGWTLGLSILALAITAATIWMRSSWTRPSRPRSSQDRPSVLTRPRS